MHTKIGLMLVFTGLALGCGHRPEERRAAPREYRADYRGDWNKLGERWVDGTRDRDVIPVGARAGAYRRIMIVVENSAQSHVPLTIPAPSVTAYDSAGGSVQQSHGGPSPVTQPHDGQRG